MEEKEKEKEKKKEKKRKRRTIGEKEQAVKNKENALIKRR